MPGALYVLGEFLAHDATEGCLDSGDATMARFDPFISDAAFVLTDSSGVEPEAVDSFN